MQPSVRKAVLQVEGIPEAAKENSLLHEMQLLFARLKNSHMQFSVPDGIWRTYKHQGQPVNVREQLDSFECFNQFIDQLDEGLKAIGQPKAVSSVFGGMFADQKIIKVKQ